MKWSEFQSNFQKIQLQRVYLSSCKDKTQNSISRTKIKGLEKQGQKEETTLRGVTFSAFDVLISVSVVEEMGFFFEKERRFLEKNMRGIWLVLKVFGR